MSEDKPVTNCNQLEEDKKYAAEVWKAIKSNLRTDQLKALEAYAEIVHVIIESKSPLAIGMFWIGDSDLLGDAPIEWISNLEKERLKDLMQHGINRINKLLEIKTP